MLEDLIQQILLEKVHRLHFALTRILGFGNLILCGSVIENSFNSLF
jgi:hypothetical protein